MPGNGTPLRSHETTGHADRKSSRVHKIHDKFVPAYREILACYCELQGSARSLPNARKKALRNGVGREGAVPSLDTIQLWYEGNRLVDGLPIAMFRWPEIAAMVDDGALTVSAIRETGRLESKVREVILLALDNVEFVDRLLRKPELLIALYDRCVKVDKVPKAIEDLLADRYLKKAAPVVAKIEEDLPGATSEQHVGVEELTDEELEALLHGDD